MVKCTKCNRTLKKAFFVEGAPYGPVCVRKLFPDFMQDKHVVARQPKTKADFEQGNFFGPIAGKKTYVGSIANPNEPDEEYIISVHTDSGSSYPLELGLQYVNHSPTGFCWGYGGSGPAQSAFAIMLDFFNGDLERARSVYQDFKFKVLASFPMGSSWTYTSEQVESTLSIIDREKLSR